MCVVAGMSINGLRSKNVRLNPNTKGQVIQEGGHEHRTQVIELLAARPMGFHAKGLHDIRYEGLGVDHDEYVKSRQSKKSD